MAFRLDYHTEVTEIVTLENKSLGIMNWGSSNSFPQTLKNLVAQSPNANPAVNRTATFLKGGTFEGEDTVVGLNGETLKDIVSQVADDYALFEAFSLHANYNIKGRVSTIQALEIPTLRFNTFDTLNYSNKMGYHPNFALNSEIVKMAEHSVTKADIKWIDRFNPDIDIVNAQVEQCEDGLLANYNGQVLYVSNAGYSKYPVPTLQAQINFVLSDIENSILVRKETATGFIDTYIYKTTKDADDKSVQEFQQAVVDSQGARGMGKIIKMANLSEEEMKGNVLERIESDKASIMDSSIKTFELTKLQITGAYLIPPALAGIDQKSGFSGTDLEEAYNVFNAITQSGRNKIEQSINRMLEAGDFAVKEIKLQPLKLELEKTDKKKDEESAEAKAENDGATISEAMRNLDEKQMKAIEKIVKRYKREDSPITLDAARLMLNLSYGLSTEEADLFLNPDEEKEETEENDV